MLLDDDYDAISGPRAVEGRRSFQGTADFEAGFKVAGATSKVTGTEPEGQENRDVCDNRDLRHSGEWGQYDQLLYFMPGMQKENAALHTSSATEESDHEKSLLEIGTLLIEKVSQ